MTRFETLIYQLKKELQLRNYADSSIRTYSYAVAEKQN